MIVCAKHLAEPAKGYHVCVGCEVESLRAEVERLKTERDTFRHGHSVASNRCCELEAEVARLRAAPAIGTAEKDAERPDFFKWWTSIETDVRKSMLVWASRDRERLFALMRTTFDAAIEAHTRSSKEQACG